MCAWVGNQQSSGVVTARVRTDAVRSISHQRRDLHQSTYPYLSEDRDSSYYQQIPHRGPQFLNPVHGVSYTKIIQEFQDKNQVVSDFGFPVGYTCVSFSLFTVFIPRSTEKAKQKNSYIPLSYNP
jgi:hypothetical protein